MRALTFAFLFMIGGMVFPSVSAAEAFRVVEDRDRFITLVAGRQLTRLGIKLNVTQGGVIQGRAFGKPVSGQWRWENGFSAGPSIMGKRDLGPNCQEVRINGDRIRFTSDRGSGIYADLKLR